MTIRGLTMPRISGKIFGKLFSQYEDFKNTGSGSGRTYTGMGIGTAASDRYVLVGVKIFDNSAGVSLTDTVTVDPGASGFPIACRELVQFSYFLNDRSSVSWWLTKYLMPTAVTATVALAFNSPIGRCECVTYSITGAELLYLYSRATGSEANPTTLNLDVLENGVAFAMAAGNAAATAEWSGIAEDQENLSGTGVSTAAQSIDATVYDQAVSANFSAASEMGSAALCLAPRPTDVPFTRSFTNKGNNATYFSKTPAAGNRKRWTLSLWAQLDALPGIAAYLYSAYSGQSDAGSFFFYRNSSNKLNITGWFTVWWTSTETFTDNKWHHILLSVDTDDPVAANRIRVWVDRTEWTKGTGSDPALGYSFAANSAVGHNIGRYIFNGAGAWNGSLTQFTFVDDHSIQGGGRSIDDFSRIESGVVFPKDYYRGYGPNDFLLDFSNDQDMGNDHSPSNNDWVAHGSPVQSIYLPRLYR